MLVPGDKAFFECSSEVTFTLAPKCVGKQLELWHRAYRASIGPHSHDDRLTAITQDAIVQFDGLLV
jgi:hypothetical protein